jgi:DNA gyrase subunit A
VRIVIDLKRDATPDVVLNQLWRHTPGAIELPGQHARDPRRPARTLNLRDIIEAFVKFREEVITRRSKFELAKARDRAHILLGLVVAVTNLDEVVKIIRGSPSPPKRAKNCSMREWPIAEIGPTSSWSRRSNREARRRLSPVRIQVRAILDLRLHRLTALGRDEIGDELKTLAESIAELLESSATARSSTK